MITRKIRTVVLKDLSSRKTKKTKKIPNNLENRTKPFINKLPDHVKKVFKYKPKLLKQRGGSFVQPQPTNLRGGSFVQPQPTNLRGGSFVQPQPTNLRGGSFVQPQPTNLIELMSHKNYFGDKINTESQPMVWGLGVEHEMQIFHLGRKPKQDAMDIHKSQAKQKYDKANIMFDSQESTCFITGDDDKAGACCKLVEGGCSYSPPASVRKKIFTKQDKLTSEELEFLLNIDWEASGRSAKGCKPKSIIVERVPLLMPELVTSNFKNRTINSIAAEAIFQEEMFIKCQMKNPFTREKVNLYGPLVTHMCGTVDKIRVPERPTYTEEEYKLEEKTWKDYVGSYHITLTLPHTNNINPDYFVKIHSDCANTIQWLEPLLLTAFFSPDPSAMGIGPKKGIEGSFRVGAVGWGNFAGADVRSFGSVGITRGAMIPTKWRDGLNLAGTELLNQCVKTAPPKYKKSINILTSDFRTFGFEPDEKKCKTRYNPLDCPKADGMEMAPPYGMEIRIFDHFHSEYLLDLLKIIVLCAANSQRHPATSYVYNNSTWINAIQQIMTHGWNTILDDAYVKLLQKHLDLPINTNNRRAYDVFSTIITEMHQINKNSLIIGLLDETPDILPRIPGINRECWELAFNGTYLDVLSNFLNKLTAYKYTYQEFTNLIFGKDSPFSRERWIHQLDDICHALESKGKVKLDYNHAGLITHVKLV